MLRFIARRILETIPVLFVIFTVTFFMGRLAPGNPFSNDRDITPEAKQNMRAYYGMDKPLLAQYIDRLKKLVFEGDFGPSLKQSRTVNEIIVQSFPVSLELGVYALIIALIIGLPAGIVAATRKNTLMDYAPMSLAMAGICLPTFVMGPLLVLLFALHLHWFEATGWVTASDRILPALTLGLYYSAYVARLARGGMLEILSQDFIRTARAKGASSGRVLFKHALKGGLLPVVSFLGPAAAGLITGSFVIETIFAIPGLGQFFVKGALNRDYFLIEGLVLFYATVIVGFNLIVDILQIWLNPKLRFE